MKISIAERSHPFSHLPGTTFVVPHTTWSVQIFPTRLFFTDLANKDSSFFLCLSLLGPVSGFTAQLDLEKGILCVFGKTQKGYIRYHIAANQRGIWLELEKTPEEKLVCSLMTEKMVLEKGRRVCLVEQEVVSPHLVQERLSLGMHKAQDWDLVRRRLDLKEIFPHWLLMASFVPKVQVDPSCCGNYSLLNICKEKIQQKDKEGIVSAFQNLFLSAFKGVLVPRIWDFDYQGLILEPQTQEDSLCPLPVLTESSALIRSVFFQEGNREVHLLPCLPPEFHCGRMVGMQALPFATLDFEWTKKALKASIVHPLITGQIHLKLPKGIRSFRLRKEKSTAKIEVDSKGMAALPLEANRTLRLDRFEH